MDPRGSRACVRGAQLPVPRVKLFARFITVGFKVDTGKRELVLRFIGLRVLGNDPEFVLVLSRRSASPLHSLRSDIEEHSSESGRISEVDVDDRRRLSRLKDRRFSVVSGVVGRVVAEGGMNIYSIAPGDPPKIADVLGRVGCTGIGVPVIGLYLSLLIRLPISIFKPRSVGLYRLNTVSYSWPSKTHHGVPLGYFDMFFITNYNEVGLECLVFVLSQAIHNT